MKVLLTGSTGYIGRRLKYKFVKDQNIKLRLFVRNKHSLSDDVKESLEVIEGDTFDKQSLKKALEGVDVAYYLIHSLNKKNYKDLDKVSASNFIDIAKECGVKRVVYLGGLGVKNSDTSEHLLSRLETGEVLSEKEGIQTIWIRAGVIIGSGSTSFEIVRNLVEKLPVMTTPKWVNTLAQPIAVSDVLEYLYQSAYLDYDKNLIVDIGCEKLSYKHMMLKTAEVLGLERKLIPVPYMSIKISSYWLNIFTPVPYNVAKALIEGLKSEVTIQNDNAKKFFPQIEPISYKQAVAKALKEIEDNQVISRWSDNGGGVWEQHNEDDIADAVFIDRKELDITDYDKHNVYQAFTSIGGKNGWFRYDFLWEIRGFIDKLFGGAGINRGRRSDVDLRISDSLDFWKVVDLKIDERLLLYAQMKVPGKAWLEFKIENNKLIQSAYFRPKGLLGRLYWIILIPLHFLIFKNMITKIIEKSKETN